MLLWCLYAILLLGVLFVGYLIVCLIKGRDASVKEFFQLLGAVAYLWPF